MLSAETVPSVTKDQPLPVFPTLIPPGTEHITPPITTSKVTTPTTSPVIVPTVKLTEMDVDREGVTDIVVKGGDNDKPFYKKWWFWAIVIGVVATGTAVYIFTRKKKA